MAIRYRINILNTLKAKGYNTTRLRNEKIFGQATIQDFRTGKIVSLNNLCKLCDIFHCDIGDLIHYVPDTAAVTPSSAFSSISSLAQNISKCTPVTDDIQEDDSAIIANDSNDADDNTPSTVGITPDDLARLNAMFNNLKKH